MQSQEQNIFHCVWTVHYYSILDEVWFQKGNIVFGFNLCSIFVYWGRKVDVEWNVNEP